MDELEGVKHSLWVSKCHKLTITYVRSSAGHSSLGVRRIATLLVNPNNPDDTKNVPGLITDFMLDGTPIKNVAYNGQGFNMGGCMGCHGVVQSLKGGDW